VAARRIVCNVSECAEVCQRTREKLNEPRCQIEEFSKRLQDLESCLRHAGENGIQDCPIGRDPGFTGVTMEPL